MNRADIQGLLFSDYTAQPASAAVLLRFADGRPNAWLRRVLPQVSSGAASERREPFQLNLAFTHRGLEKLRLPAETLAGFSREYRQGMAHEERSALLGDRAPGDPAEWAFTDHEPHGLDGVALLYAPNSSGLDERLGELEPALRHFGLEYELLRTYLPSDGSEHFGLSMGVSEPNARGLRSRRSPGPRIATGEFLLGYRDGVGDRLLGPTAPVRRTTREPPPLVERGRRVDFGFNGSYLVLGRLEQRVDIALEPSGFSDRLGAHVRRANARDSRTGDERDNNRHRLLLRGRLYGARAAETGDESERGLLFLALSADIARQFEQVQGQWRALGLQGEPVRRRLGGLSRWVRVRGDLYGFLPSLRALGYLADLDEARKRP